ncbi:MAG: hypothetical protein N2171_00965 [Clostridia bacterium]|nr:hypothetical protein [Clostridia bacterium]
MGIEAVSSVGLGAAYDSGGIDNSEEIKSLANQKARLQQELSEIRSDKSMDENDKKLKMQKIAVQINTLQTKIEILAETESKNYSQKQQNKEDIDLLKKKKAKLHAQMSDIRSSNVYSNEEKRVKIHEILNEIYTLKTKIQEIKKQEIRDTQKAKESIYIDRERQDIAAVENLEEDNEDKKEFQVNILV